MNIIDRLDELKAERGNKPALQICKEFGRIDYIDANDRRAGESAERELPGPGKYEGTDALLATAMDVIAGNGDEDECAGSVDEQGAAWRVDRFVAVEDSQGFITVNEYPNEAIASIEVSKF